ncbi:hypothetical protein AB1N83_013247 [Pleurotus pulmonarius]
MSKPNEQLHVLLEAIQILFQRRNTDDSDSPDAPPEPPSLVVLSLRSGNVALTREIDRESSGDGEGVEWKLQTPIREVHPGDAVSLKWGSAQAESQSQSQPESKPELESKSELKSKSELTRSLRSSDGGENEWAGAVAWEDFHALAVQHYCGEQTLELVNTHDRAAITVRVQVSTASPSSSIEGAECRRLTTAPHQGSQQPETRECADTRRPRSRYLFCAMPDEDDLFDMEACGYRYADVQPPTDSPDAVFPPKSDGAPRDSAKIHWRDYYQTVVSYAFIAIDDADTIFKIRTPEGLEAMTRVVEGSKGVHSIFCTDAMTSIDLGHISPS